jgi:hypothetical protein
MDIRFKRTRYGLSNLQNGYTDLQGMMSICKQSMGLYLVRNIPSPSSGADSLYAATGSDYFSFCFPLHIPKTSDLVLVELAVNDQALPEHTENMENLLRGLLDLPNKPAVILVEALAFSNGGMGGGGGRIHLPVAQYYGEFCWI